MRLIKLFILGLLPTSALAGELPADALVRAMLLDERAPSTTEVFLPNTVSLGPASFSFEDSYLEETVSNLGGEIVDEGAGDYSWACFVQEGQAIWLLSDRSDVDGKPLTTAIVVTATPVREPRCSTASELEISGSLLQLGLTQTELDELLGPNVNSDNPIIAYQEQAILGDGGGSWLLISTLAYHFSNGVADAVALDVVKVR